MPIRACCGGSPPAWSANWAIAAVAGARSVSARAKAISSKSECGVQGSPESSPAVTLFRLRTYGYNAALCICRSKTAIGGTGRVCIAFRLSLARWVEAGLTVDHFDDSGNAVTICHIRGIAAIGISICTLIDPMATHPQLQNHAVFSDANLVSAIFGWMMLGLAILTINLAWYGWLCVIHKRDHTQYREWRNLFLQFATFVAATNKGVALEPTELDRERSTFIHANQALRRRMIGDDNSRAAGYGLYLFRIPVSVLPGRETTEGYSAVATLRAQLQVDQAHLRNTFPKMVIADLVEALTPRILNDWNYAKEQRKKIADLVKSKGGTDKLTAEQRRILSTASFKRRIEQHGWRLRVHPAAIAVQYVARLDLSARLRSIGYALAGA